MASALAEPVAVEPVPTTPTLEMEPRNGTGRLITAATFTGVGALSVAAISMCMADWYSAGGQEEDVPICVATFTANTAVGFGVGLPLFVSGAHRKAEWRRWRDEHAVAMGIDPLGRGLVVSGRF